MPKRRGFALRLRPEVYQAVARWAEDELRSINGQIEYLLLDALKRAGRSKKAEAGSDRESATHDPG